MFPLDYAIGNSSLEQHASLVRLQLDPTSYASSRLAGAFWVLFLAGITIYGYVSDKFERHGNKYPILGDCGWWRRRIWFWTWWNQDMNALCFEGYNKYNKRDEMWATWVYDELFYVLPTKMIAELKSLPAEDLSFIKVVDDHFLWRYHLGNTLEGRDYVTTVKKQLNPHLPNMTEYLAEQIDIALSQRLVPPKNSRGWRTVMLWDAVLDFSHRVVGALMVGPELGATEDYIEHARGYTETVTAWSGMLFTLPSWLRAAYFWTCPTGRKIRWHLRETKKRVVPELRRRVAGKSEGEPVAMIDGLLEYSPDRNDEKELEELTNQMLFLTFAASGLYCVIMCQLIYTIMGYPEYMDELRTEITTAVTECGGWSKQAVDRMPKLDSFFREALRISPPTALTLQRKLHKDILMSDGTLFKAGTNISIPTLAILHDEELYPDPEKFDPWRFYDAKTNSNTVSSVTQTPMYNVFGYGTQTCPGRYFASRAGKLALAKVIVDYEMKFVPERKGKPVDWPIGGQLMPNVDTFIAFRRRDAAVV